MADWYMAWAADHCQKFGFRDADALMVLAWRDAFSMLFTADELKAATGRMLVSEDAPRFASDHRGAIIRAVQNARMNAGRKANTSSLVAGCIECGGNGIVVVPHPGCTDEYPPRMKPVLPMPRADPTGLTRVMGVCCVLCEVGVRTRATTEQQGRPLATVSEYESRYPNWREVEAERLRVINASRTPPTAADVAELERTLKAARAKAAEREQGRIGY
jgi:hypothetical protein